MARRQILIDWDRGASGIWWVTTPEERAAPCRPDPRASGSDRPKRPPAWRDLLGGELLDALQACNGRGEEVLGIDAHRYSDNHRAAFWQRGHDLADEVQRQLAPEHEVICRGPRA